MFGVFKSDFDSYEGYLDFETGVLHRISSRIYLAEWLGPGSHIKTIVRFGIVFQITMFILLERVPTMVSSLNVPGSL